MEKYSLNGYWKKDTCTVMHINTSDVKISKDYFLEAKEFRDDDENARLVGVFQHISSLSGRFIALKLHSYKDIGSVVYVLERIGVISNGVRGTYVGKRYLLDDVISTIYTGHNLEELLSKKADELINLEKKEQIAGNDAKFRINNA